jgi:putative LysE/RhtB family amino acid efflux pump
VALGTLTAFTALSLLVASVRRHFGARLLTTVDVVAGSGLLGFAGLLGWRAVHES